MTVADASQLIFTFHNVSINTGAKIEIASYLITTDNLYFLFYQSDSSEISTTIHMTECHSLAV